MYAIIATGGKQYKVAEGDVIKVEKLGVEAGNTVTFDRVLAVNNGSLSVGNPTVAGASVSATVVEEGKANRLPEYPASMLWVQLYYCHQAKSALR